MLNLIASRASAMLVVSRRMAADLRRVAPAARIEVLYNGANLPPVAGPPASSRPKPPVIFSAGCSYPTKHSTSCFRPGPLSAPAFRRPDCELRATARSGTACSPFEKALALRIRSNCSAMFRNPSCKPRWPLARAFALASWHETFGVVLLEAAAVGTPVIWADNAGAADVLEDGIHGLAIAPHSAESAAGAILRLLSDPDAAATMGAAASRLVRERMTWDAVARQAIGLFSEALPTSAQRLH